MKRLLSLILVLLMLACVPTPEVDAVKQKNQDAMIEMAHGDEETLAAAAEGAAKTPPTLDYFELYDIPEHLSLEIPGLSDKVRITVDADINVPKSPLPIVRAAPTDFSQEQVYDLWNRLIGDRVMYLWQDGESKETIQKSIEFWMQIQSGELVKDMYDPEEAAEQIETLKKKYADAPDTLPTQYADGTLVIGDMQDGHGKVVAHRTELQAYESQYGVRFNVQNNYDNTETIRETDGAICVIKNASFSYSTASHAPMAFDAAGTLPKFVLKAGDPIPEAARDYIHTTPAEIQARAQAMLEQMGIADRFAISEIKLLPDADARYDYRLSGYAYRVDCVRLVNGVPVCNANGLNMNLYALEDMVAPEWCYETLYMWFDDSEDVFLNWSSPTETQEVVESNCRLQPFSEIRRVLESRLPMLLNRRASSEHVISCTANVRRIDLGLWRIREKNTVETGLLVPAYCFYLDIRYEQDFGDDNFTDILIINAVDGTVIDPWNGY
ncbi:MAG: hypothetical protein IKI52_06045 [Clostridia bacterium]|nr:hypothetical protein [Clostridia bacterium]MBQ7541800.1 hypothetical protein [Clostridia bacterium]MBR3038248.1 hypothetical protein [Clostridia bacterium]